LTAPSKSTKTGTLHFPKKVPEGYRFIKLLRHGGNSTRENEIVWILTLSIIYGVFSSSVTCDYVSCLASEISL
jgi:hypothetical protein